MDDVRDRPEDEALEPEPEGAGTRPEPEFTGPITDRVRIVGAEPAGGSAAVGAGDDVGESDDELGPPMVRLLQEPASPDPNAAAVHPIDSGQTAVPSASSTAPPTELPHWTEPPTGQVPAVLAREGSDEGSGITAPTWREEDADWVAHEGEFEPSMFGDDDVAVGSLDETDSTDIDRRPWEFDLDSVRPGAPSPSRAPTGQGISDDDPVETIAPITEPTMVVRPVTGHDEDEGTQAERPPVGDAPTSVVPAAAAVAGGAAAVGSTVGSAAGDREGGEGLDPSGAADRSGEDVVAAGTRPRPTGSTRSGRERRSGLRSARVRAKRPEESDLAAAGPLAAEPPGASVTDVPGVGLKRGGFAGLAAADRSAQRETAAAIGDGADVSQVGTTHETEDLGGPAVAGGGRRRTGRWPSVTAQRVAGGAAVARAATPPGGPPREPSRSPRSGGADPAEQSLGPGSSIGVRIGTGIAVAVIALLAFKLGTVTSLILCLIVVTFAAGELFSVLRRAGYRPATLLGLVGTIVLMIGAYDKGVAAVPLILVLITVFTLLWYLTGIEDGAPVAGTAATMITIGWVSLLGSYAGLLLSPSLFPDRHGIAFLLGAIIATVANDVGALLIGGGLGRHPLAPSISPNKTWEGLFGGAVFSIVFSAVIVGDIHPWSPANAALLGVVVAVVAPIGDLCESLVKRDLKLKDMGNLLPGHGGVLDRVDALLLVLPATYYLVRALNIG